MKLDYKILWFDDLPEHVKSMEEGISTRLARLGFNLEVEWIKEIKDEGSFFSNLSKRNDIDLILMDWNMGQNKPDGATLSQKIRRHSLTEIIFYSSASKADLRKAIFDKGIDGVFCFNRAELVHQTVGVINTTIKKILDLNHLRGLVLGTVSGFEGKISELLENSLEKLASKNEFIEQIKAQLKKQLEENKVKIDAIDANDTKTLIDYRGFTSAQQYHAICKLISERTNFDPGILILSDILKLYRTEVIEPRNALAHSKATEQNGNITFQGRNLVFDERKLIELRQYLLKHSDNFTDIQNAIDAGLFDSTT
ncbi:Response regulator [uncultured Thiomicrorhabdus sp.]